MGYGYDFLDGYDFLVPWAGFYFLLVPLECIFLISWMDQTSLFHVLGFIALLFHCSVFLLILWKELSMGICKAKTRLEGKVAVVTGGNAGIGFETAKNLAARGARIIIGCRSRVRGEEAVRKIIESTGNKEVSMMDLDLAELRTVKKFADNFCAKEDRLDILVNNAGIAGLNFKTRTLTNDNNEMVIQTNHLGHFLLTHLLKKQLAASGNARVVNVSSQGNSFYKDKDAYDLKDINSEKEYGQQAVYTKSKLLNILFSNELARRWRSLGISSFSLHPGFVRTEFFNHLPKWAYNIFVPLAYIFEKSCFQGAQTSLHCCLEPGLEKESGTYWSDCRKFSEENSGQGNSMISKKAWDSRLAEEVWDKSATLVELKE